MIVYGLISANDLTILFIAERGILDADDEAAMLAQLDAELGIKTMTPAEKAADLKQKIAVELKATMDNKQAGNREQAIIHLKEKKRLEAELQEHMIFHPDCDKPQPVPVVEQPAPKKAAA